MFIAHLPAGYIVTSALLARSSTSPRHHRALLATGLVCSVLPDLDLVYFYLVDGRQHPHHSYWPHLPVFWFVLSLALAALTKRATTLRPYLFVGTINVLLHLMLDSVAAEISWFLPFSARGFGVVTVPANHEWWVLNFVLHWTFALELLIVLAGIAVCARRGRVLEELRRSLSYHRPEQ